MLALMRQLGRKLAADLEHEVVDEARIVEHMNNAGYEAQVFFRSGGEPQIVAHNCVFHRLAAAHPVVCANSLHFAQIPCGTQTTPSNNNRAVRINPHPANCPSFGRNSTVNSPVGCSIDNRRTSPSPALANPVATVPSIKQAAATLTAPNTPMLVWQRCGMKLRVLSAPPA
ncbi:hypothetical protein D3C84_889820 [compost metagenome]